MFALVLVAISVGFSNLAASVGMGAGGVDHRIRIKVAAIFGVLEAGMPIVGLLIGHSLASRVGSDARWIAAVMLGAVGGYGIVQAWRTRDSQAGAARGPGEPRPGPADVAGGQPGAAPGRQRLTSGRQRLTSGRQPRTSARQPRTSGRQRLTPGRRESIKLLVSGFALSLDNLVAGFALGAYQVGIVAGALVFGLVSIVMSLAGLELGARVGRRSGVSGEVIGGVVLVGVGVAIGVGALG